MKKLVLFLDDAEWAFLSKSNTLKPEVVEQWIHGAIKQHIAKAKSDDRKERAGEIIRQAVAKDKANQSM